MAMGPGNNKAASGKRDGGGGGGGRSDKNANAVLANIMSGAFGTAGGNPLLKIAMGGGFLNHQDGLAKQKMISENARRRHLDMSGKARHYHYHQHGLAKHSFVPKSHETITKQQIAELLASKHGQISIASAKTSKDRTITREQVAQLLTSSAGEKHVDQGVPIITKKQLAQLLKSNKLAPVNARKRDSQLTEEELRYQQSQRFHSNTFEQDSNQILGVKPGADDILKTVGAMQLTGKLSKLSTCYLFLLLLITPSLYIHIPKGGFRHKVQYYDARALFYIR